MNKNGTSDQNLVSPWPFDILFGLYLNLPEKDFVDATPHLWEALWLTALGFRLIRGCRFAPYIRLNFDLTLTFT